MLVTASGALSTGIKARLYQTTGISTPADYDDESKWTETSNTKCYTDSSESALTCGAGLAKPSAGNTKFFLSPTDGHMAVGDWLGAITGQSFSSIIIDSDTQF
ncbi:MAG: hypothetical protein EBZ49_02670 [Proteobacteria bacterium]|nr:hypothetical protein [Pseudomonadota bacterium]